MTKLRNVLRHYVAITTFIRTEL